MQRFFNFQFFFLFFFTASLSAQNLSTDSLFRQAQTEARAQRYGQSRALCLQILSADSLYIDAINLAANTYAWERDFEKAADLNRLSLQRSPGNHDAMFASVNLFLWDGRLEEASKAAKNACKAWPESLPLLKKNAEVLIALKDYPQASALIEECLQKYPQDADFISLKTKIKALYSENAFGVRYAFDYFNSSFPAWHTASAEYSRFTPKLDWVARATFGRRFDLNGGLFEADFYPKFKNGDYMYLSMGLSPTPEVFPRLRAGADYYKKIGPKLEASAGLRWLVYSRQKTVILTGGIGKYVGNSYWEGKIHLGPATGRWTQAYTMGYKYYLGGAQEWLGFLASYGFSPDMSNVDPNLLTKPQGLRNLLGQLSYNDRFRTYGYSVSLGLQREEYAADRFRLRIFSNFALSKFF